MILRTKVHDNYYFFMLHNDLKFQLVIFNLCLCFYITFWYCSRIKEIVVSSQLYE